ncbi:recombinase family protein [Paenibacillus sp. FSL R10-2796]|uniref:recombinase family protein n=1 Tax=Paenibacillus sp. FSL R10-2796 TaxID=2954663 RepID=UPI0030D8F8F0
MINAVIYISYNSKDQHQQSAEIQSVAIKEYAAQHGYQIIREYRDETRSGTPHNRPQFLQLIKDSAGQGFQKVIVYNLELFSRDRFDASYYKHILKKYGIELIPVMASLDKSPDLIIIESLLEGIAEHYSRNLEIY